MKYILYHIISSDSNALQIIIADYVLTLENLRKDNNIIVISYGALDDLYLNVPLKNFLSSPKFD